MQQIFPRVFQGGAANEPLILRVKWMQLRHIWRGHGSDICSFLLHLIVFHIFFTLFFIRNETDTSANLVEKMKRNSALSPLYNCGEGCPRGLNKFFKLGLGPKSPNRCNTFDVGLLDGWIICSFISTIFQRALFPRVDHRVGGPNCKKF